MVIKIWVLKKILFFGCEVEKVVIVKKVIEIVENFVLIMNMGLMSKNLMWRSKVGLLFIKLFKWNFGGFREYVYSELEYVF